MVFIFQYPRTDRGVCNKDIARIGIRYSYTLSVSSNGSWCVQLLGVEDVGKDVHHFQYPRTDRGVCNGAACFQTLSYPPLSVSSNGSWCVQQFVLASLHPARRSFSILERIVVCATSSILPREKYIAFFQYPRTDRGVCNFGSEARNSPDRCSFSILERIVVCATTTRAKQST